MMPTSARPPMGGGSPMSGAPPSAAPSQGAPGGGGGAEPSPEQAKQMLMEIMKQAKAVADKYGIDLMSLIPQGKGPTGVPPPPSGPTAM